MKKLVLLFCFYVPIMGFSQPIDSTKMGKFSMGLSFSPDYCSRTLKTDAPEQWLADMRDTLETPKYGYTTGLNLIYKFNTKIEFETGVLFSDKGYKIKNYSFGNPIGGDLPTSGTLVYHYYYLDIPLKANYYVLSGKIKLFLTAGISTNILLNASTVTTLEYGKQFPEQSKSTVDEGLSRLNFAALLGVGMELKLTGKSNFRIEPLYNRSLNSITDTSVKEYLYSIGLNIGFYFKL